MHVGKTRNGKAAEKRWNGGGQSERATREGYAKMASERVKVGDNEGMMQVSMNVCV